MKNRWKPAVWFAVAAVLSACGSGQAPVVNMGQNGYNAGWNSGYNYNPWNPNGGFTQQLPGGGTMTVIPVAQGTMQAPANRVLVGGAQVQAGDQIRVNAYNAGIAGMSTGFFQMSGSLYLTALRVSLNGTLLGASLNAQYSAPQSGTLQVSFTASGWPTDNYDLYQVMLPQNAVSIVRCRDAGNQPMTCPN